MSKNSKQARKIALAKEFTKLHKEGNKGPSKTEPKHGKAKANRTYMNGKQK